MGIGGTGEGSNDYGQMDAYRYQIQRVDTQLEVCNSLIHWWSVITKHKVFLLDFYLDVT